MSCAKLLSVKSENTFIFLEWAENIKNVHHQSTAHKLRFLFEKSVKLHILRVNN